MENQSATKQKEKVRGHTTQSAKVHNKGREGGQRRFLDGRGKKRFGGEEKRGGAFSSLQRSIEKKEQGLSWGKGGKENLCGTHALSKGTSFSSPVSDVDSKDGPLETFSKQMGEKGGGGITGKANLNKEKEGRWFLTDLRKCAAREAAVLAFTGKKKSTVSTKQMRKNWTRGRFVRA